jgi:Xaa-Pro aminopeptidase
MAREDSDDSKASKGEGDRVNKTRFRWVSHLLTEKGLDGFLVTSLENVRYLSGFTGSDAALLLTKARRYLLTDSRYTTQARGESRSYEVAEYIKKVPGIADIVQACHLERLGFESQHMTHATYTDLTNQMQETQLVPLDEEIRSARIRKEASEIRTMRRAIAIAEEALLGNLHLIKPGISERDVALEIEFEMRRLGAESIAFDTIVASGSRGALPHGKASEKRLAKGDMVVIDFGARFHGYHSDQTCTVCLGSPKPEQKKIYSIVKEAHDRAIASIKAGVPLRDIDRRARQWIDQKGYGPRFGHGLGHGVGLAVHEEPRISPDSAGVAEKGMVFTVEPGIYIPEAWGVRIEDMVLVGQSECEILTQIDKELKVL